MGKIAAWILAVLLAGCAATSQGRLTVRPGEPLVYRCDGGQRIMAQYYSLSDGSLAFVKVQLPDGREVTLPQALSASGVRYTNDVEWVWWTKGDAAFAETRAPNGGWHIAHKNCRETAERR